MNNHEALEHQPQVNGTEELLCPTCGYELVPVWTLPEEKTRFLQPVEIREQFYCQPCDTRYALEELLLPKREGRKQQGEIPLEDEPPPF